MQILKQSQPCLSNFVSLKNQRNTVEKSKKTNCVKLDGFTFPCSEISVCHSVSVSEVEFNQLKLENDKTQQKLAI